MTKQRETISLVDDQGNEHEFSIIDVVEVAERRYAILQPTEGEEEAVIFRLEDDETLSTVEDDEEFARVAAALQDLEEYDEIELPENDDDEEDEEEDAEDEEEDEEDRNEEE